MSDIENQHYPSITYVLTSQRSAISLKYIGKTIFVCHIKRLGENQTMTFYVNKAIQCRRMQRSDNDLRFDR